jgi:hypothetical protein
MAKYFWNDPVQQIEILSMARKLLLSSLLPSPEKTPIRFGNLDSEEKEIVGSQENLDMIIAWLRDDRHDETEQRIAVVRLIDSVWTLVYERVSDTEIKILRYDRENKEGYDKEKESEKCKLVEDKERNIISVVFYDKDANLWDTGTTPLRVSNVINPQHIFSYYINKHYGQINSEIKSDLSNKSL